LNDQWHEVVSALVHGESFACLCLAESDKPETLAMVKANHLAFRFVLCGGWVWKRALRRVEPGRTWGFAERRRG
jgi:hypothetical protein